MRLRRRELLAAAAACGLSVTLPPRVRAQDRSLPPRLLFVVAAAGGASIIDSFLPVVAVEAGANASTLHVQPSSLVSTVGNFRCVGRRENLTVAGLPAGGDFLQHTFLTKHGADTAVMTLESTSVNHLVAQKRMITGAGINNGRTIQEATALVHGGTLPLPNVNMAAGGYLERGDDPTTANRVLPEAVADARTFPLAMHGIRGVKGAPAADLFARARRVRDTLDDASPFGHTFANASLRQTIIDARKNFVPDVEQRDLIKQLMLVPESVDFPLAAAGLAESPDGVRVREKFPALQSDPFAAQAAMAFLLAKNGVSTSMTLAPSFQPVFNDLNVSNTPLAFDFSHNDHPSTQNLMWSRMLAAIDGLIDLLKAEPDGEGGTLWDRSLVYIATDFGREKVRPANADEFGTGHHLNNGVVMVSPLLKGGRVYGGVDPTTCLTYGFDPVTGDPAPGTLMREGDVYAVIAGAMGVDYVGRREFPSIVRS
jgi:hypothetical protein